MLERCISSTLRLFKARVKTHCGFDVFSKPTPYKYKRTCVRQCDPLQVYLRRFFLFLSFRVSFSIAFFIGALCSTQYAHAGKSSIDVSTGTIDFVKGYVTVFPRNDKSVAVFAKRGLSIQEKDRIITGDDGFASLSFNSSAIVNIQPSSDISVEKLDCILHAAQCQITLTALKGFLNSSVDSELHDDVQFTINTPYASAAVRGTVFDIEVNDERLLAGVTEGGVNLSAESGQVELPENYGSWVQADQPPATPKPLLSAPIFSSSPARYDGLAELEWSMVANAVQYVLSLSNATGLVYREETPDATHRLRKLDVGTYSLNLRGIDTEGLRGQVAERSFDVVATDTSRTGPTVRGTIEETEFSVSVSQQSSIGNKVELQFSTERDFEQLIYLDAFLGEVISADRPENSIFVRARGILSNTEVTPFGPVFEVPGK